MGSHTMSTSRLLLAAVVCVIIMAMATACNSLKDKACNVEVIPAFVKRGDTVLNPGTSVDLKLELISGEQIPQHIFYVQKPDASFDTVFSESRYYTVGPEGAYKLIVSFPACEGKKIEYDLRTEVTQQSLKVRNLA